MREFIGCWGESLKVYKNSDGRITLVIMGLEESVDHASCELDDLTALDVAVEIERLLSKKG